MTSETDNSSDSGISGDLAEELDYQNTHKSDGSLPEKNLYIQEVNHGLDNINLAFQDSDQNNAASTIRKQPERLCKQKQGENVADLKIEDMIANFLNSETLTGENQYECDRCGGKQDAERSLRILETPDHLILTQLRFYYDTSKGQRQKVFTNVDFKEELLFPNNQKVIIEEIPSVSTDVNGPCLSSSSEESKEQYVPVPNSSLTAYDRYALYGVVVHSGFSSEGGHYYCYARSSSLAGLPQSAKEKYDDLGEWFNFNDERVTKTTFCAISRLTRTFTRDTAYLLFYRKMDITYRPEDTKVPLLEDFSSLRQELQDLIDSENLQYQNEQEHEQLRKRVGRQAPSSSSSSYRKTDDDEDPPPPPPSSGGTCGDGNGLSLSSPRHIGRPLREIVLRISSMKKTGGGGRGTGGGGEEGLEGGRER
ncbi:Ubiquitin carboxyl-terminal hydrolase 47, partial [Armadillidium nasatum]